jgi:serine/threonine-protein kinase RsbT
VSVEEIRVPINSDQDIVLARQRGKALASEVGFSAMDTTLIATAISELARNIVSYAKKGEIALQAVRDPRRRGIMVVASDQGPGIADIRMAVRDGFSTSGSLGLGLPGVKRLMDEFQIASTPGRGTVVRAIKWRQEQHETWPPSK